MKILENLWFSNNFMGNIGQLIRLNSFNITNKQNLETIPKKYTKKIFGFISKRPKGQLFRYASVIKPHLLRCT